jgi:hypothetical protein
MSYRVTLVPLPGGDVPPIFRLKAALKRFLRSYRLRCTKVEEVAEDPRRLAAVGAPGEKAAK